MTSDRVPFRTLGARYPVEVAEAVESAASTAGVSVSDWLRQAVERNLGVTVHAGLGAAVETWAQDQSGGYDRRITYFDAWGRPNGTLVIPGKLLEPPPYSPDLSLITDSETGLHRG